ncbi:BrnA antitoxin family protein [Streptomyces parvus]|uniref:BrnA antitoxin family protein n=1 Tax=Streptomyces parvus TaxID=66428 RepID=UPI0021015ADD|nr:BrnA antitoxin family protein [Streptomyces parvus]MCQ1576677.1 BrnA antitoxin family protein [Streptomyces parvus]
MTDKDQSSVGGERELEELAEYFQSTSLTDMDASEIAVEPARYPMTSRSIRMEQAMMQEIRTVAKNLDLPVTQLMRHWIKQGLEREKADSARNASYTVKAASSAESNAPGATGNRNSRALLPTRGRSYPERLMRQIAKTDSDSDMGQQIERSVLKVRAMRGSLTSKKEVRSSNKRERSSN